MARTRKTAGFEIGVSGWDADPLPDDWVSEGRLFYAKPLTMTGICVKPDPPRERLRKVSDKIARKLEAIAEPLSAPSTGYYAPSEGEVHSFPEVAARVKGIADLVDGLLRNMERLENRHTLKRLQVLLTWYGLFETELYRLSLIKTGDASLARQTAARRLGPQVRMQNAEMARRDLLALVAQTRAELRPDISNHHLARTVRQRICKARDEARAFRQSGQSVPPKIKELSLERFRNVPREDRIRKLIGLWKKGNLL